MHSHRHTYTHTHTHTHTHTNTESECARTYAYCTDSGLLFEEENLHELSHSELLRGNIFRTLGALIEK